MQQTLVATERLIVDIEIKPIFPKQREWMTEEALSVLRRLKGTGISCVKVESLVRGDYTIIDKIHDEGFKVFADLKLDATEDTFSTDGVLLKRHRPEYISVMCSSGPSAMKALQAQLPETKILGVTVLTNQTDEDVRRIYACSIEEAARRLGQAGKDGMLHGLISGPREVKSLRMKFGHLLLSFTPGIRPEWATVSNDDQNPQRTMTPTQAFKAGADYFIVGRPITQAVNPHDATLRILEEMEKAMK